MDDKENTFLKNRIRELSSACWQRDIPTYTDFLALDEQAVFRAEQGKLPPVKFLLAGGYPEAERKIACFLPSYAEENDPSWVPIVSLDARPADSRFTEELTHRDYLGALMNLGIERSCVGDLVLEDKVCHLFCLERIADYITREFTRVRHTEIVCARSPEGSTFRPKTERVSGSLASVRLDALVALAFRLSRTKAALWIDGGKAFVDGTCVTSASFSPKPGAVIAVRGLGKFRFAGTGGESKKGRIFADIDRFC
jgi:RNA-binding protein YlmH